MDRVLNKPGSWEVGNGARSLATARRTKTVGPKQGSNPCKQPPEVSATSETHLKRTECLEGNSHFLLLINIIHVQSGDDTSGNTSTVVADGCSRA